MKNSKIVLVFLVISICVCFAQVQGEIIQRELTPDRYGYSVVRLWGNHYEMGYAFGYLFADDINNAVLEARELVDHWGYSWTELLFLIATYSIKPDSIESEFQGIADGVNDSLPSAGLTANDVKAVNLYGDIAYLCRSVSSWGSTVSSSGFSTISTRRLDYSDLGLEAQNHHVIAIFEPNDGSPAWINFGWPGYVTCVTGVNEFGTMASLHDYYGGGELAMGALPRVMACRYALTMVADWDMSCHMDSVFEELNTYDCATAGFMNYFVPDGYGGVIKHNRSLGYYEVRKPHPDCFFGEAIYTNNSDISGASVGEPWASYYSVYASSGDISMSGQWGTAGPSFHRVTVGYRSRNDMLIWFDGSIPGGVTSTVELEWSETVGIDEIATNRKAPTIRVYPNPFNSACKIDAPANSVIGIYDIKGNRIERLSGSQLEWEPFEGIPNGVYFISISNPEYSVCQKVIYMK